MHKPISKAPAGVKRPWRKERVQHAVKCQQTLESAQVEGRGVEGKGRGTEFSKPLQRQTPAISSWAKCPGDSWPWEGCRGQGGGAAHIHVLLIKQPVETAPPSFASPDSLYAKGSNASAPRLREEQLKLESAFRVPSSEQNRLDDSAPILWPSSLSLNLLPAPPSSLPLLPLF